MKIELNREEITKAIQDYLANKFQITPHSCQISYRDDYGSLRTATWDSEIDIIEEA